MNFYQEEEGGKEDMKLSECVCTVKEEPSQEDDFVDDKVHVTETSIIVDNVELQSRQNKKLSIMFDNIKREFKSETPYDTIFYDVKVEEEINSDGIKSEFNSGLLHCEDCHTDYQDYCTNCRMLVYILNTNTLNYGSREELPNDILEIKTSLGQFGVYALKSIPERVIFGPFTGLERTERHWKIKRGKFIMNKNKSKYTNWMKYVNPARNTSEHNLVIFQYERNLYYRSSRQIQEGDELLVHFGEEYEDSLNRNVEMDFVPNTECMVDDVFACTFCCLGFSSKSYLTKHKATCSKNATGEFSIGELMQCPTCKIHLDQKEYIIHHMAYCCEKSDRKCTLPTRGNRTTQVNGRKTRPRQMYECHRCRYRAKYKGDLKNHANQHYELKMYKCGVCYRRYKRKEVLRLHMEQSHVCADRKGDLEHSNTKVHIQSENSENETKQWKCSMCECRTKYKHNLKRHMIEKHLNKYNYRYDECKVNVKSILRTHIETKHLKEFKYKCDTCDYKTNWKSDLNTHVQTKHSNEFVYKCDTCDFKTNADSYLKIHVVTKHLKEFKYKCDRCDYKTNWKFYLETHTEAHHLKEIKYDCGSCEYKTNCKNQLRRHVETKHLNVFNYKCDACDYKTNLKFSLKTHVETKHLKEFKYKCGTCDYETNRKSNLKTHVGAKHLKEFKYKCDRCDYKANLKSCLKRHVDRRHLREFKYKCDTCNYQANDKSNLKIHMKGKHI